MIDVLWKVLIFVLIVYIALFMIFPVFTYEIDMFFILKEVSKMFSLNIQNHFAQGSFG